MFDLLTIKAKETDFVPLKDGTGTPYTDPETGDELGVTVYGPTTPIGKKAKEKMFKRINDNAALPKSKQNAKAGEEAAQEYLKEVVTGFVGFTIGDKQGKEAIEAFATMPELRLHAEQVLAYLLDNSNFLPTA
ncbi:MAG TPA: hypothetical protein VFV43_09135 [Limnobacter sp.]|nr:hypothetical protein [Limnobacter sp.]